MTYKTQAQDTTIEAEKLLFNLLKKIPIERRVQQYKSCSRQVKSISWKLFKDNHPHLTLKQLKQKYIKLVLGEVYSGINKLIETEFMINDAIELAAHIGDILEGVDIPYFVGGGLASSFWGEQRFTNDADIVILLISSEKIQQFIDAFEAQFYISEVAIDDALRNRTNTFNVIHTASVLKADIYPIRESDEFRKVALTRRRKVYPSESPDLDFYICSAEDIVLQKLIWYGIAGNESQKQWRDVLGVLKLQGEQLDFEYLREWGLQLKVTEELNRAFSEAGLFEC